MKVYQLLWVLVVSCVGLVACEEKEELPVEEEAPVAAPAPSNPAAPPAAAPAAPAPAAMVPGPVQVCSGLVDAAKAKDAARFASTSTPTSSAVLADAKLIEQLYAHLSTATCSEAKVAGEGALVTAATTDGARELPFAKAAEGWKFDAAAYIAKYPFAQKQEAAPAKGKGKGRHHGKEGKGKKKGKGKGRRPH